ncbi:hypothetical protein [Polaribacter sp. Z022]|uniref:hypothetical protein n=1 Tax=Polaribacter sp. Z022 TaxID=2927125 RepID=UPI0020220E69|nr:hypothetical protein [Polaribacter sp. Z022]MCL7754364.1 hypothetical protein [Polaribacter sp. Z022]
MKFQINPLISDIFISIYIVGTLYFRIKIQNEYPINPLFSILIGFLFILFIWALIKVKILNPNWFGLFNVNKARS